MATMTQNPIEYIASQDAQKNITNPIDWPVPQAVGIYADTPEAKEFLNGKPFDYELGFLVQFQILEDVFPRSVVSQQSDDRIDVNYILDIFKENKGLAKFVNPTPLIGDVEIFCKNRYLGLGHTHPTGGSIIFGEADLDCISDLINRPEALFTQQKGGIGMQLYIPNKGIFTIEPKDVVLGAGLCEDDEQ
jgi:hypothetical protein